MEFLKKSIHMDQIGCEEQTQITLEDDVNIADAKPDVYQVVTQQGHVELRAEAPRDRARECRQRIFGNARLLIVEPAVRIAEFPQRRHRLRPAPRAQ